MLQRRQFLEGSAIAIATIGLPDGALAAGSKIIAGG